MGKPMNGSLGEYQQVKADGCGRYSVTLRFPTKRSGDMAGIENEVKHIMENERRRFLESIFRGEQ